MTAESDISWSGPGQAFNLRVAAIITCRGRLLLCRVGELGHWFLPGGRVRFGESSAAALARELSEELGLELTAGELALVVENIYTDRALQHEIGLYYRLTWPDHLAEDDLHGGIEPGHAFRWLPMGELGSVPFQPDSLVPVLQDLGGTPWHVVLDRRAEGPPPSPRPAEGPRR